MIRSTRHFIGSGFASKIFLRDPVIPVNTNKRTNVATAGARSHGVFAGCSYITVTNDVRFGY